MDHKEKVVAVVERNGKVRSFHVKNIDGKTLGVDDQERAENMLSGVAGKRLMYKTPNFANTLA